MRLSKATYQWALRHLIREGDTDLFPPLFEIEAFRYSWKPLLDELLQLDISMYHCITGREVDASSFPKMLSRFVRLLNSIRWIVSYWRQFCGNMAILWRSVWPAAVRELARS
jgi:hypothetical protein